MKYEIGREVFKQRLEERLNFAIVNVQPSVKLNYTDVTHLAFDSEFVAKFASLFPNKSQNIIVFTTTENDQSALKAADGLAAQGYSFVYFYRGTEHDVVLDKGLN